MIDQHSQSILAQKQAFQIELNEITNALEEIGKSPSEAYKIIGNIMIKADPKNLKNDLEEKKKLLDLRISSIEKQEKLIEEKADVLRKEINAFMEREKKD